VSALSTLMKNPVAQGSYRKLLESGFVPRRAFAHYFMNTAGIRSRVHLQNYYSMFFPDDLTPVDARVWLYDSRGSLLAHRTFSIPAFGQLYLEIRDIAGEDLDSEGMIVVDVVPPKATKHNLKTLPNIQALTVQTPFWVSYRDDDDNYMYVHSIEVYRGRVFGAVWPVNQMLARAPQAREPWESWRLLDVNLLDELQVVVMNHSATTGTTRVKVISPDGGELWSHEVTLNSRESRRVEVPTEKIEEWRKAGTHESVRVALSSILSDNGKPYVLLRYGDGPLSMHHG